MAAHRSREVCAALLVWALLSLAPHRSFASQENDPVARALADGQLYESKRNYQLALDSYRKADKLSRHSSSQALFKIALIEKKAGLLSDAANDAKKAIACAQGNKPAEVQARLLRATLLTEMAGKPTDNKLKDAEAELRGAIVLEPSLPLAHLNLAMVLFKQERDADGIAEMRAVLAIPSTDPEMAAEAKRIIANPIRARAPFAPDFAFHSHDNQDISNASLRGKVAVIDFWGTWCPPCRESVPILKDLQKKYNGKPFQLISISSDDDEDVWKTFVAAQHMDWTEYLDSSGVLQHSFKIDSFPTYIVVDKDGVIRFRQSGLSSMTEGELEEAIGKALKRPSNPALLKAAAAGDTTVAESEEEDESDSGAKTKSENATASAPGPVVTAAATAAEPAAPAFEAPEGGQVSGNVYSNRALGLRFEFPSEWIAAKPEALHTANEQLLNTLLAAFQKQHPDVPRSPAIRIPKSIFYASRRGDGDAQHATLSSIRIQAVDIPNHSPNEDTFRLTTERMVSAAELIETSPPTTFDVKGHKFMRADFERKAGALHYYQGIAQTDAGEYLLTIEWYAASSDELRTIGDYLQKMEIQDQE